jgi:LmbE family N-acetylglucosaminyl deacetylase
MKQNNVRHLAAASLGLSGALALFANGLLCGSVFAADPGAKDGTLRIICFGAHPDDCELKAGGVGAMWAAKGHKVKLVSVSNGDIGHWREAGGPLALRRTAEAAKSDAILGVTSQVLDIHDGEIMPTLEYRRIITRLIREWQADIVISPRPNDYHPDHRYTSVLVQDAAYMVTVPFFCPDVPALKSNPLFLYYSDGFQKPNPFTPDIAVSIDSVIEKKLDALDALVSQFYEGGANGSVALVPSEPAKQDERRREVRSGMDRRSRGVANEYRAALINWYGQEAGSQVKYAETFEICEYGGRPAKAQLKRLFPFFGE